MLALEPASCHGRGVAPIWRSAVADAAPRPLLMRIAIAAIAGRWSPVAFCARWHEWLLTAEMREVFGGPAVTWADLAPFGKASESANPTPKSRGES